jgi:hypothetical protein
MIKKVLNSWTPLVEQSATQLSRLSLASTMASAVATMAGSRIASAARGSVLNLRLASTARCASAAVRSCAR